MRRTAIGILAVAAIGSSTGCGACLSTTHELVFEESATLDEAAATGRGERDSSSLDPWDRSIGQIASSDCGDLALLRLDPDRVDDPGFWGVFLRLTDADGAVDEVMVESGGGQAPEHGWSVAFDDRCDPVVVAWIPGEGWRVHRGSDGVFVSREVRVDWSGVLGSEPAEVAHWTLERGGDGEIRVFAVATDSEGLRDLVVGLLVGDDWTWTAAPLGDSAGDWELLAVAGDPAAGVHLAFRQADALRWGRWNGSDWTTEVIERAVDRRVPAWGGASLAIGKRGYPHIASTSADLDEGGAPLSAELRHHNRQDSDAWASCSIVTQSGGGFAGAAGDCCSGASPALVLDEEDRPHIVFNDVAAWEGDGGRDWSAGRLRYVFDNGRSWDDHVVIDQDASGDELFDLRHPMLALGADGVVHFAGAARSTSAAGWEDLEADFTVQTLHVRARRVLLP